jgi:membrane protein YqaA with SNARE-associated domain
MKMPEELPLTETQKTTSRKTKITRIIALLFSISITVVILIFRKQLSHLGVYGYPGIFLISVLANATVIIPVPGVLITSTMATVFPPIGVAIAAGLGAACGEMTGYFAGFSGQAVIENRPQYEKLSGWMKKYGSLTIFLLAFIPNPAFDLAGIVAGALKLPIYRFLFWCALGKVLKMLIFAYAGSTIFGWMS